MLFKERRPRNILKCSFSVHKSQTDAGIRSMAIRHFGELLKDMSQYTWMLNAVVLESLVPLILFLEDTETRVVMVSPATSFSLVLRRCTLNKEMLIDRFLLHRHVNIHW